MKTSPFLHKKVLVTGGYGFIGSNLAKKLVSEGARVTIFDNTNPSSGANRYNIKSFESKVQIIHGDLLEYEHLVDAARDQDFIFNCAASTSHPFSMREPLSDLDVNGKGMINLLEAVRRYNHQLTKFVHIGTTTQTGELLYKPANENHPEFPTDVYSASKSLSEKYTLIYGRSYSLPVTVVRFPNVYGPRACINSSEFNFVNYFIGLALQNKSITVYGEGNQLRNVLYIKDAVSALLAVAGPSETNNNVYIACGTEHISVLKIAQIIADTFKSGRVKSVNWPRNRKAIEVGDAVFTSEKIQKAIGWQAGTDFVAGLHQTQKYYNTRLKEYL